MQKGNLEFVMDKTSLEGQPLHLAMTNLVPSCPGAMTRRCSFRVPLQFPFVEKAKVMVITTTYLELEMVQVVSSLCNLLHFADVSIHDRTYTCCDSRQCYVEQLS